MSLDGDFFGTLADGREVRMLTLANAHGMRARIITYGAIIVSLEIPDQLGKLTDIVLGHDTLESYVANSPYFGAIVGRYANRISNGSFSLDGVSYNVSRNEGTTSLHGGVNGFDKAVWEVDMLTGSSVRLAHTSPDGDQGFPGALRTLVTYALSDEGDLTVDYEAAAAASTVVNLSQHTYWNLAGAGNADVLGHELTLAAGHFTPVDADLLPTGEIRPVDGTAFDFRRTRMIGARMNENDEQLGAGYDHNFVLDPGGTLSFAARMRDPVSGRSLEIRTTEPGLQVYTGNRLDGSITGKRGMKYHRYGGICLETQHFPDSPNRPEFPSTVVRPGEPFRSRTVFSFGAG
jgi:aldose 1-epimerase